jgi:two-component system cell cycle sensor histidine kinase/response regulator CckA
VKARIRDLWGNARADRRLIAALLDDPLAWTALLDREGSFLRIAGGWNPPGPPSLAALPAPAPALIRAALAASQALSLATTLGAAHVALRLTPVQAGRAAGVLRLSDRSREHDLEEALGQATRLQEVGELAGGIAHDFNNLLTAILGAADDLAERLADRGGDAADAADLAQIRDSATRGAALVRQLLAFSQRQTLQPRVLALDEAVGSTAGLLRRLLGSQVTLVLELKAPGRFVLMDPTQFDQVLMNLAINARNAMPDGGTITIATDRRLVLRAGEPGADPLPPGRYVTIDMTDTGSGIPADILPRIFDPFFTTRRGEGGTGLGLSMVQGIVRQSGGTLTVRSTLGAGTCFRITLPRHEAAAEAAPPTVPAGAALRSTTACRERVLLVDDDDAIRRLAKRALTRAGWIVTDACSADEALSLDPKGTDCVVSDVTMPGLDGPALVRALRVARPKLPAVLISGYADAAQRQALMAEDIAFLPKPFAMADLTRAVRRALDGAAAGV